jgi:hypothetical protein
MYQDLMIKTQKIKMSINVKCLIFFYFQYKEMKMQGLNQQLDIKILLYVNRDNSSRMSRSKTPSPSCKDNKMKKMMRKAPPKNSTKERFLVIPHTLNSHNRGPRRLKNHLNLPSNHQTQQLRKIGRCTQLFKGKACIYTSCKRTTHICTRLSGKNPSICVETHLG